jgi:hypothetical protein
MIVGTRMNAMDVPGGGAAGPCKGTVCLSSQIQVKSYSEVGKLAMLFRGFDDAKRNLVRSIRFDGLSKTPFIDDLDDKFSMVLTLPNGESLPVTDVDAHLILGIPFRGKDVFHDTRNDKDVVSNVLVKLSIGGQPASLTLEYLEWVLDKNYGVKFQEEEKVAFQIAVVLYSMACFLAGPGPKKCFPIWLLRHFVGDTKIAQDNWSGYVLSVLAHGALQVQDQLRSGAEFIKLPGCTFLLQV